MFIVTEYAALKEKYTLMKDTPHLFYCLKPSKEVRCTLKGSVSWLDLKLPFCLSDHTTLPSKLLLHVGPILYLLESNTCTCIMQ